MTKWKFSGQVYVSDVESLIYIIMITLCYDVINGIFHSAIHALRQRRRLWGAIRARASQ